ncbi:MAG: hypothetical protein WCD42_12245 [Rhizomicrobium sp.]
MSDFFPISSVDRREEMIRLHNAVKNNVAGAIAIPELKDDGELPDQPGHKHKRTTPPADENTAAADSLPGNGTVDDGGLADDDDAHSIDVTV